MLHIAKRNFCNVVFFNDQRTGKIRHRRKQSIDIDNEKLENEFNHDATPFGDANIHSVTDVQHSPSTSRQVQDATYSHQIVREEWAATRIQTAFRGFLVIISYCL